jgi:hypothetical protein
VQRRYERFIRSVKAGEYSGSNNGSNNGSGDQNYNSPFNSPIKSGDPRSPQSGGVGNREALLFNLLEMPARQQPTARSDSVLSRISTALMPCFFTRRSSRSRGSSGLDGDRGGGDGAPAGSYDHSEHVYSSVPTDLVEAEEGAVAGEQGLDGRGSGGSVASAGSGSRQLSLPADRSRDHAHLGSEEDELTSIQSHIQTELTINQIRGSTCRSNLSSITSANASRNPSFAVSRTNTLTLPTVSDMEVTVLDDVIETSGGARDDSLRQSLTGSGGVRRSSLAAVLSQRPRSFPDLVKDLVPPAVVWAVCVSCCLLVERWVMFAGVIGMLCTSVLVFLLPSMIYFRVGVFADYQAAPILCGTTIPNRLYMFCMQIIGLLGTLAVLGLLGSSIAWPSMYSYGYSDSF